AIGERPDSCPSRFRGRTRGFPDVGGSPSGRSSLGHPERKERSVMTKVPEGPVQGGGESSVRRLRRRTDRKWIAGVAGGVGDYLGLPAWVVRLAFTILAFTGAGILLYVIGWVLIPAEGESESVADRALSGAVDGPAWLGGLLLLIGAILIASHTHLVAPGLV